MSIKNNIEMVKEELNSEEKFFEKAIITERFVKKYKKYMIAAVIAIVVIAGGNIAYDIYKQNQITAANEALAILSNDEKNSEAISTLKKSSPDLYDVWIYSKAIAEKDYEVMKTLTNSSAMLISDLATYELAQERKDAAALDSYALKQGSIYRDLALVQSAIIMINNSKIEKAHEELSKIPAQSSLYKIALSLLHYGVK